MENLEFEINKKALEKIHQYAKIVCDEAKGSRECYGFLLAPKEKNDGIIYDAILACNQYVTATHGEVDLADVKETKKEYDQKGYKAIGCWQSHGEGEVFHSSTDNSNLENLIIEAGANCLIGEKIEEYTKHSQNNKICLCLREGNEIEIDLEKGYTYSGRSKHRANELSEPERSTIKFTFEKGRVYINIENASESINLTTNPEFLIRGKRQKQEDLKSIVYSLVVNTRKENYAEAGIVEWNNSAIKKVRKVKDLKIKEVEVHDAVFFEDELRREVRGKVKKANFLRKIRR